MKETALAMGFTFSIVLATPLGFGAGVITHSGLTDLGLYDPIAFAVSFVVGLAVTFGYFYTARLCLEAE
jgi:hypothetical protein